jgi:hypothetical protein
MGDFDDSTDPAPAPDDSKPAISQYWDAEEPPGYLAPAFASFRDRNPDFRHRVFSEKPAEALIGKRFGAREAAAFKACAVPAMQSDYFSYCAVLALGGVYADADYRCRTSLRPLLEQCEGGEIFVGPTRTVGAGTARETTRRSQIWNGFFVFRRPGHPLLRLVLDVATANMEARIAETVWPGGERAIESIWLTVGPGIFSVLRLIRDKGSFDAFLGAVADSRIEPFASLYCEAIGDYGRLAEAFQGVRVSPFERMALWIEDVPRADLPYKESDLHWHNVKTSIFR